MVKLFDKWECENIEVKDLGIAKYIKLQPVMVPRSGGKHEKKQFYKSRLHIVERLMNKLFVSGHRGKKHKISSGNNIGKSFRMYKTVKEALEIIEQRTKKNPVEVLVRAIENAAPIEEVITFQKGGIFAREGVVTSPQRRVDLVLKHLAQGTYQKSFKSKKSAAQCLADEIILTHNNDSKTFAISEKMRREKEASGAR